MYADYLRVKVVTMLNTTNKFADTTDTGPLNAVLDDALRSLRISGSLLLRETYAPPWAIAIPGAAELGVLLEVGAGVRVVAFHLVEFGHCAGAAALGDRRCFQASTGYGTSGRSRSAQLAPRSRSPAN